MPARKASTQGGLGGCGVKKPILAGGCCARAANGHPAAAPPSSVMNSRRLMSDMDLPPSQGSVCRDVSLSQSGHRVLWRAIILNRGVGFGGRDCKKEHFLQSRHC